MIKRKRVSEQDVTDLLVACRRRCCLCYYLDNKRGRRKGQIAHLNRRADDSRPENLAWLCLKHHDEYDSTTRQSKGLGQREVRTYRDMLVGVFKDAPPPPKDDAAANAAEVLIELGRESEPPAKRHWRFPLWLTPDRPELFAYTAPGADGICAIERIDLPDGRVVAACNEVRGNPGKSITNAAEHIFEQFCARFGLAADQVVWLEHYDDMDEEEWRRVFFRRGAGGRLMPRWVTMTPRLWKELGLSPKESQTRQASPWLETRLDKHFPWPPGDPSAD